LSQSYKHYYSKYFIDVKRSKCLRIIIISFDLLSFQSFFDEINKNLFLIIKKAMHCLVSKRSASFHLPFFAWSCCLTLHRALRQWTVWIQAIDP
jgi:hypothetical protein